MRHVAAIEDTRELFVAQLRMHNALPRPAELDDIGGITPPYPELVRTDAPASVSDTRSPVFVTGRFRSGSTLIWNLFRQVPSVTSYYEPFNERRWFDKAARGAHVDSTHLNVDDYWREYDDLPELGELFDEDWKFRHLYMNADSVNVAMQRYIEIMIRKAGGRPVLQFNEVDFRLGWLKAHFPSARLLHVYRHPREQWLSTLRKARPKQEELTLETFREIDGFYLTRWGKDLQYYFPFLDLRPMSHPYRLFYQIWRLSYAFGVMYADLSISLEQIVGSPRDAVARIMNASHVRDYDLAALAATVSPSAARRSSTAENDALFERIEAQVDAELAQLPGQRHGESAASARSVQRG